MVNQSGNGLSFVNIYIDSVDGIKCVFFLSPAKANSMLFAFIRRVVKESINTCLYIYYFQRCRFAIVSIYVRQTLYTPEKIDKIIGSWKSSYSKPHPIL